MSTLNEQEGKALALFKERVESVFSDKIDSLHLFGSKARGKAKPGSDVDVLVIANVTSSEVEHIIDLATEIQLETNVDISPKIYSKNRLEQMRERHNMFWQSIEPDLIRV